MNNIKQAYRAKKSFFSPKGKGYGTKTNLVEGTKIIKLVNGNKIKIYTQGRRGVIKDQNYIDIMINADLIEPIDFPSDEEINNELIIPSSLEKKLTNINKAFKNCPDFGKTLKKWITLTKGSSAVNEKTEIEFQKNKDKILCDTVLRGGQKRKPGEANKNRSYRETPICNEEKWYKDETTLLANGIKENEYSGFKEQEKIHDTLIKQIINMYDCPDEIVNFYEQKGFVKNRIDVHRGSYFHKPISFFSFLQNTHHGKVKGLELAHKDQKIKRATVAYNLSIDTCEENRFQGGNTKEDILLRALIDSIIQKKIKHPDEVEVLEKMNHDELIDILYLGNQKLKEPLL
jgi:hypothetical protein